MDPIGKPSARPGIRPPSRRPRGVALLHLQGGCAEGESGGGSQEKNPLPGLDAVFTPGKVKSYRQGGRDQIAIIWGINKKPVRRDPQPALQKGQGSWAGLMGKNQIETVPGPAMTLEKSLHKSWQQIGSHAENPAAIHAE